MQLQHWQSYCDPAASSCCTRRVACRRHRPLQLPQISRKADNGYTGSIYTHQPLLILSQPIQVPKKTKACQTRPARSSTWDGNPLCSNAKRRSPSSKCTSLHLISIWDHQPQVEFSLTNKRSLCLWLAIGMPKIRLHPCSDTSPESGSSKPDCS